MPKLPDPITSPGAKTPDYFELRVRFVCELSRRLHQYGTSAPILRRLGFAEVATVHTLR